MASKTIPELTAASALTGQELLHVVQSNNSRKATLSLLLALGLIDEDDFASDSADKAPSQQSVKAYLASLLGAWTAFTPTFSGLGTITTQSFFSRRVGDSLEVMGKFTCGTPPSAPGVEARISLALGTTALTIDTTKVPSIRHCGTILRSLATTTQYNPLILGGNGYMTISRYDTSYDALYSRNGSELFSSGNVISVNAVVPISGW